ncbi:hypothetical protein GCN78_23495 [Janthinobacterium rivuli]|uniref:hypothetical protein n=1 Tax=Janthinobacterium sp. FT68W TaxID=2654255 RepID=UPI00126466D2|nr:hypothetical protein [Janthinobacterium sp. FT68W]KAB8046658.1 hypothetical protein GCN78_23495 [Janthinobacterium sp. FT68W]
MMKKQVLIVILLLSIAGGLGLIWSAYHSWQDNNSYVEKMTPYVKRSSIRLENAIGNFGYEKDLNEIFSSAVADMSEWKNDVLAMQIATAAAHKNKTITLVRYLDTDLDLRRAMAALEVIELDGNKKLSEAIAITSHAFGSARNNSDISVALTKLNQSIHLQDEQRKRLNVAKVRFSGAVKEFFSARNAALLIVSLDVIVDEELVINFNKKIMDVEAVP